METLVTPGRSGQPVLPPSRAPSQSTATTTCSSLWVSTPTMTLVAPNGLMFITAVSSRSAGLAPAGRESGQDCERVYGQAPCILFSLWDNHFTQADWGAADRMLLGHGRPSDSVGRRTHPEESPNSIRGGTSSLLGELPRRFVYPSSILWKAPKAFPGGPERLVATAAYASLPPMPRCMVSRAGAGSDRKNATPPRPGSPSRHRGTGLCVLRPFRRGSLAAPVYSRCPGTKEPSPPERSGPCCPTGPIRAERPPRWPR